MAMIPFPYDFVYAWAAKHNIEMSKEASNELIEMFIRVSNVSTKEL